MADTVLFQDGDELSEDNLSAILSLKNNSDYVESGMELDPDFRRNKVTIGNKRAYGNHAIIRGENGVYHAFPDQKTKDLATSSGINHIFININTNSSNKIDYDITEDENTAKESTIKIGIVDCKEKSISLVNRAPDADFENINTTKINSRSATLESKKSIIVDANGSGDYSSIQRAIDEEVPYHLKSQLSIYVRDGDYSSENIKIPGYTVEGTPTYEGAALHLQIIGNEQNPSKTPIGSVFIGGTNGVANPKIAGFEIQNDTPYNDEKYGFFAHGCREVEVTNISFADTDQLTSGFIAYRSGMSIRKSELGDGHLKHAYRTKRGGEIEINDDSGDSSNAAYFVSTGSISYRYTSSTGMEFNNNQGIIFDSSSGRLHIPDKLAQTTIEGGSRIIGDYSNALELAAKSSDGAPGILARNHENENKWLIQKTRHDALSVFTTDSNENLTRRMKINSDKDTANLRYSNGDIELESPKHGIVLKTPDGNKKYRVCLDNNGDLMTEGPI
ncbi:hypothetical protein [Haloarcula marina]|uniref:hypothetical protein n=1 Tax=Haloarcula marina TaxID=2961574 RepID=UPI0020B701D2|nr:hypothetical protein [Halomicroarcula marina]